MKKLLSLILGLCCLLFAGSFVQANNSEYEYKNLNITADILKDGTMNVRESFKANFFVEKHGIIRTIPLNYSVGGMYYHIDISDIDVKGQPFTTTQGSGSREIKIGDSDKTITGEQRYPITYTVYGLIKNYEGMGYSELYWNLVGYDFDTNINSVRAVLHLPKVYTGFTSNDFLITTDGKSNSVEDFSGTVDWSQGDSISITYESGLDANQGITLSIKFPEDYFEFDDDKQAGLMGKAKIKDIEDEEPSKLIAENIVKADNEAIDEHTHLAPETTGSSIVEEDETIDEIINEIINDAIDDNVNSGDTSLQEEKPATNVITNNGYVSSRAKPALNSNPEYEYTNLNITAKILDDGTMTVKENYTADFHINKHGIIRTIPLNYTVSGFAFHIDVSDINVEGKTFRTSKAGGDIEIKIGDADRTVIGTQNYPISYTTYGLVRNFSGEGFSDFYWNLVGYDFDTSIRNVYAEIILPSVYTGFTADDFQIAVEGNAGNVFEFPGLVDWGQGDRIIIKYDRGLSSYQGITLSIRLPNNYFTFDHDKQAKLVGHVNSSSSSSYSNSGFGSLLGNLDSLLAAFLPFGIIAFLIYSIIKSFKSLGKIDTKSGGLKGEFAEQFPVIVQYEPPQGINSAEAGLLLHRSAKVKDMLSLIYKRAAEGGIKISTEESEGSIFKRASKSVIITKIKDINSDAPEYEKDFFRALVRGEKNKVEETTNLYSKLHLSSLEKYGETKGWLTTNRKIKLIPIFFISVFILAPLLGSFMPSLFGVLILAFFFFTVSVGGQGALKETQEGAKLIAHILGYRNFLKACDENKLRLFLQQDPLYFDKILPYAVAFGLDTELIKKIEPIMQEMNIHSTWYDGDLHSITTINNIISNSANHSAPKSTSYSDSGGFGGGSSFSGGFSSGGGGGGGGGRSW